MTWGEWAGEQVRAARERDRERLIVDFDARGPEGVLDGQRVVSFASNDYLGLTVHPQVIAAAHRALERWGAGSGAARLTVGSRPIHRELEHAIAEWKKCDGALIYASGYAGNSGVIAALGERATTIFSDELNHASLIDGCRLARSRVIVYPHGDVGFLAERMSEVEGPAVVVTDAVFSMDGDAAPLEDISAVCASHDALLVVDEAHAVLETPPIAEGCEVVRLGTMSKFLGSLGGFAAASQSLIAFLTNRARSFVFSTAPSPPDTAAALAALSIVESDEGRLLVRKLQELIDVLRPGHPSPIIPVVLGSDTAALEASRYLLQRGMFVPAIRPPSVPEGTARLRVALSASHTRQQVEEVAGAIRAIAPVNA